MWDALDDEKLEVSHLWPQLWNVCGSRGVPLPCRASRAAWRGDVDLLPPDLVALRHLCDGRLIGAPVQTLKPKYLTTHRRPPPKLQSIDWRVVTVWECATKGRSALTEPAALVIKLKNAISGSDFESTIRGKESEQKYE